MDVRRPIPNYQRSEVKDALALLRLAATPDSVQGDEALRRVINTPARGFGPKAMAVLEEEAAWRQSSLLYQRPYALTVLVHGAAATERMRSGVSVSQFQAAQQRSTMVS